MIKKDNLLQSIYKIKIEPRQKLEQGIVLLIGRSLNILNGKELRNYL